MQLADEAIVKVMMYDYLLYGVSNVADLLLLIPGIAVGVRRFHDTSRSGWLPIAFGSFSALSSITILASLFGFRSIFPSLISGYESSRIWFGFIAIVTICLGLYYIFIAVQAGTKGLNEYGPDPLNPHLGNEIDLIGEE